MNMYLINEIRLRKENLRRAEPLLKATAFAEAVGTILILLGTISGQAGLIIISYASMLIAAMTKRAWLPVKRAAMEADAAFIKDFAKNHVYAEGLVGDVERIIESIGKTYANAGLACYWRPAVVLLLAISPIPAVAALIVVCGLCRELLLPAFLSSSLHQLSIKIVPQSGSPAGNTVTLAA